MKLTEEKTVDTLSLFVMRCGMLIATVHSIRNLITATKDQSGKISAPRVSLATMNCTREDADFVLTLLHRLMKESDEAMELCETLAKELCATGEMHDEPEQMQ